MDEKERDRVSLIRSEIKLDANESSDNLPEWMIEEIEEEIARLNFNRYPDPRYLPIRKDYAALLGLKPEQVAVGTGSDELLMLLLSHFAGPDQLIATLDPDFGMYAFFARLFHGKIDAMPFSFEQGLPLKKWAEHIREIQPSLVLFSNPHNPSGALADIDEVRAFLKEIYPTPLCLDEAYIEFGNESALELLNEFDNLFITRTLSKAFRFAAVRVGFLLSQEKNIEMLEQNKIIYDFSALSQAAARVVLRHAFWFLRSSQEILENRKYLYEFLKGKDYLKVYPSAANFLCVQSDEADEILKLFKEAGIALRNYPGKDYFRISIGSRRETNAVEEVFALYEKQKREKENKVKQDPGLGESHGKQ